MFLFQERLTKEKYCEPAPCPISNLGRLGLNFHSLLSLRAADISHQTSANRFLAGWRVKPRLGLAGPFFGIFYSGSC